MTKTEPLNIRIPVDLKRALERLATADSRTLSNYVILVLSAHVNQQEGKPK